MAVERTFLWVCDAEIGAWSYVFEAYDECGASGYVTLELESGDRPGALCTSCGSELGPDHLEEVSAEEAAKRERDMDRLREAFAKLNREDAEYRDLQRRCAELREEIDREVQGG